MKLVYDMQSLPDGLDPGNMTKIYEQHNVVYWDSAKPGLKPALYHDGGERALLAIVDTKGEEVNIDEYQKMVLDKEFWDRELYNCKASPMYFYANYATTEYPHTQDGLRDYLKSIGLATIVAKDDEDAQEAWAHQKDIVAAEMASLSVEFLQERKAVVDVLKSVYDDKVLGREKIISEFVKLTDKEGLPLEDKKKEINVIEKIKRTPVLPKWSDPYRTRKGKWDVPILANTSYGVLLEIYYDVLKAQNRIK